MTITPVRPGTMTRDEARALTDEVKADAQTLWRKLLRLYEGNAHLALGHKSWGAYYVAEFGGDASRGYQLLQAGRVLEELHPPTDAHGEWTPHSKIFDSPPNDHVARELVPLLRNGGDAVREAWEEAVGESGDEPPTAKRVREVVKRRNNGAAPAPAPVPSWQARLQLLVDEAQFILLHPEDPEATEHWLTVASLCEEVAGDARRRVGEDAF